MIYPVDNAIQFLNNRGQHFIPLGQGVVMKESSLSLTCCDAMQAFSGNVTSARSLLDCVLQSPQFSGTSKGLVSLAAVLSRDETKKAGWETMGSFFTDIRLIR